MTPVVLPARRCRTSAAKRFRLTCSARAHMRGRYGTVTVTLGNAAPTACELAASFPEDVSGVSLVFTQRHPLKVFSPIIRLVPIDVVNLVLPFAEEGVSDQAMHVASTARAETHRAIALAGAEIPKHTPSNQLCNDPA